MVMAAEEEQVAHIVDGPKFRELTGGEKQRVKAMCGAFVVRSSSATAPVCRGCFVAYRTAGEPVDAAEAQQKETA